MVSLPAAFGVNVRQAASANPWSLFGASADGVLAFDVRLDYPNTNATAAAKHGRAAVTPEAVFASCAQVCKVPGTDRIANGLGAFDLHTGALKWIAEQGLAQLGGFGDSAIGEQNRVQLPVFGGGRRVILVVSSKGEVLSEMPVEVPLSFVSRLVIGERGPVVMGQGSQYDADPPALQVGAGSAVVVDDIGSMASDNVVLAAPDLILVSTREQSEPPDFDLPVSQWPHQGLFGLSGQGEVVWRYTGPSLDADSIVLPDDGVLFARSLDSRLLAIRAPVQGMDPGPWPLPNGTTSHTRRARR